MKRSVIHTVPTNLGRQDSFYVGCAIAGSLIAARYIAVDLGIAPLAIVVAVFGTVWGLTLEAAEDMKYIGGLSVKLRNLFGLRQAHEWALVWAHYWRVAVFPCWRLFCVGCWLFTQQVIGEWLATTIGQIRWLHSRLSSWASTTRYNLLVRLAESRRVCVGQSRRAWNAVGMRLSRMRTRLS